jgi:23S rRNA pseudouridine2605 synthase
MRLQLFLARAGLASRRASEEFITSGRVKVNGVVVSVLGSKVEPSDLVEVDDARVKIQERMRYILLHKPTGYLCSMSDPEGRPLAVDLLPDAVTERVYNVGRLDQWSSGIIIFTNDGDFAALLSHPSSRIEKEYEVVTDLPIPHDFPARFKSGVVIEGQRYRALRVDVTGPNTASVVLVEGRNREIRRVLEVFGLRALSLCRMRIGFLTNAGLPVGAFRDLSPFEVERLYAEARRDRG